MCSSGPSPSPALTMLKNAGVRHSVSRACQTVINRLTGDLMQAAPLIRSPAGPSFCSVTSYRRINQGHLWVYPVCYIDVQNLSYDRHHQPGLLYCPKNSTALGHIKLVPCVQIRCCASCSSSWPCLTPQVNSQGPCPVDRSYIVHISYPITCSGFCPFLQIPMHEHRKVTGLRYNISTYTCTCAYVSIEIPNLIMTSQGSGQGQSS